MKLNLGSGNVRLDGFYNIDKSPICQPDLVWDIEETPWPIEPDSVEHILAGHSLEHVHQDKFPDVVREMYRVSQDGAEWYIYVPHGLTNMFIKDPTHRMPFALETFNYFSYGAPEREIGMLYGWGDIHLEVKLAKISGEAIDFIITVRK